VESFAAAFATLGYERSPTIFMEAGYEYLAIYAVNGTVKHMARHLANDNWISKLGDIEDVQHELRGVERPEYGTVAVMLRRRKS
jgi:hypothetical protein